MKNRLVAEVEGLYAKALELIRTKNRDYAGDADPYANFRTFGWKGIIVRISDKFQRVVNFAKEGKEFAVTDESFEDTMIDMANYCMLAVAMRREEMREVEPELPVGPMMSYDPDTGVAEVIKFRKYETLLHKLERETRVGEAVDKLTPQGKITLDPKQYSTYELERTVNRLVDELDRRR